MTPSEREAAGQRIARARRRRGLSQAVLAGLVGRSESWLSQVERGKRGVDRHSVLARMAEVLRVDIAELTGSADRDETGRRAHPAASLIEQAMMGYGAPGPVDGGEETGREVSLDFLRAQARSAYQAYQATRYDAAGRILPGLISAVETAARIAGANSPAACSIRDSRLRHHGRAAEPRGRAVPGMGGRRSRHVRRRAVRRPAARRGQCLAHVLHDHRPQAPAGSTRSDANNVLQAAHAEIRTPARPYRGNCSISPATPDANSPARPFSGPPPRTPR